MMNEVSRPADSVEMEVFSNRLLSITEVMAIHMMKSSFSAQIKERRDFSVGIFDAEGHLLAQGTHIPLHLGSLLGALETTLACVSIADMRDGDSYICNDPYLAGGTHLPDIAIVTPVFLEGGVVAFVANIGHHTDVGGIVPGSIAAGAKSIFEEGIRIPVVRIARDWEVDGNLLAVIAANSRLPDERALDLRVQVTVNRLGSEQTRALFERMGIVNVRAAVRDLLSYTSHRLIRHVAAVPEKRCSFESRLDDDGTGQGRPVRIVVTVWHEAGKLHVDFTGTDRQVVGAMNVSRNALKASVYYCVKTLLDPELMPNSGLFDAVTISAPPGSIVSPDYPAACGARSITCQKVARAVFGAFRGLLPAGQVIASSHDVLPVISLSGRHPGSGAYYVYAEAIGGGAGATAGHDGMDAVQVHVTNSLNMPSEVLEIEFPLLVEEYGLAIDSGGNGHYRGGLGIVRQLRVLADETVLSVRSDSHKFGADGVHGGGTGQVGALVLQRDGAVQEMSSKVDGLVLDAGTTVRFTTPGGGGFGSAKIRPVSALMLDLKNGVLTREQALRDYGDILQAAERAEF
ncbi:hydantoinase B/oxoprolinase family protein [Gluconobacter sp. P1C6_b]|uniref:hydantoinase B/oxoprolinase family protein n=1 Tax=Gluconobacter sp. P1C6_b TaxID=2762619 RepID=UPI001C05D1F9|nr:hydantoinase B/oxoprolinase family protein [Gluconobacter sp. P1C6_b]